MSRVVDQIHRTVLGLTAAAVLVGGGSAFAQSPSPAPSPDPAALERARLAALCDANATDDVERATCEWVVDSVLAPAPQNLPWDVTGAADPPLGVALQTADAQVALVGIDWDGAATTRHDPKDKDSRLVGVRLRIAPTEVGGTVDPSAWTLTDPWGTPLPQVSHGLTPQLQQVGSLDWGMVAKGWITFVAPKGYHSFTLTDATHGLRWQLTESQCSWFRRPGRPARRLCLPMTGPGLIPADPTDLPMPEPGASIPPVAPGAPGGLPSKGSASPNPSPVPSSVP